METFEIWLLKFVGLISPPSQQKVYIFFGTYYVTMWVDSRELTRESENFVLDFLFEEIVSHDKGNSDKWRRKFYLSANTGSCQKICSSS